MGPTLRIDNDPLSTFAWTCKKAGMATQLDLKSAIANRQYATKMLAIGECQSASETRNRVFVPSPFAWINPYRG